MLPLALKCNHEILKNKKLVSEALSDGQNLTFEFKSHQNIRRTSVCLFVIQPFKFVAPVLMLSMNVLM